MREIEFRGFHVGDGQDVVRITGPEGNPKFCGGRWLTGSLVRWADGTTSILRRDPDEDDGLAVFPIVLPETVGEWTGYCNKNGRRIYEGDRVRLPGDRWADGPELARVGLLCGAWCVIFSGGDWDFLVTNVKDAEVVGTVYDPEVAGAAE